MGKSNKVALVCQVCGATFYKVPSAITMETRCCSKECRGKVQAERLELRRRELAKELDGLRTESPVGKKDFTKLTNRAAALLELFLHGFMQERKEMEAANAE